MNVIYILVVLWFPNNNGNGKAMLALEFNGRNRCMEARAYILKQEKPDKNGNTTMQAVCVLK